MFGILENKFKPGSLGHYAARGFNKNDKISMLFGVPLEEKDEWNEDNYFVYNSVTRFNFSCKKIIINIGLGGHLFANVNRGKHCKKNKILTAHCVEKRINNFS